MFTEARRRLLMLAVALVLPTTAVAQQLLEDFLVAVNNDKAADVRAMLARGMDANTVDANGDPVLFIAARGGHAAVVDVLLAAKADVDRRNRFGEQTIGVRLFILGTGIG